VTNIPMMLTGWTLDTERGVIVASFTDLPGPDVADPASWSPTQTIQVELEPVSAPIFAPTATPSEEAIS